MTVYRSITIAVAMSLCCAGCNRAEAPAPAASTPAPATEAYAPGLGEIMTLQQMRHTKLWLSGEARNWELASYELKELGEGFDDIVKFHPTHEESPVAPKDAIPRMIPGPLKDLETAVGSKDVKAFETAYDSLTSACNDCHQATNFGFNRVQRPTTGNPYPDQVFAAAKK
jgi:hypothetical protein